MSGRRLVLGFLVFLAVFTAALIWFRYFAFYERVRDIASVEAGGRSVPVADYEGIDAASSPLKLRACFRTAPGAFADVVPAPEPEPLTPPPWFRCFDTGALARDLAAGRATAHLAAADDPAGFDRIVAVYPDGRGYLWRQLGEQY